MQIFIGTKNAFNRVHWWRCHFICLFIMINIYSVLVQQQITKKLYTHCYFKIKCEDQNLFAFTGSGTWSHFLKEVLFLKVVLLTWANLILLKKSEVSCILTSRVFHHTECWWWHHLWPWLFCSFLCHSSCSCDMALPVAFCHPSQL